MRIRSITIQGFRGFNQSRTIYFNDRLTLICGPNSYGKTSISEALEWLLYGVTSKVEEADYSKEEYKGSYRNRHFPKEDTPFVKATFVDDSGSEIEFRGDLSADDRIQRFVDGDEVETWPLDHDLSKPSKPFILQHALKRLLLVRPKDRYEGFARLLGLEDLSVFHADVVSLCTKPEVIFTPEVVAVFRAVSTLQARCADLPRLSPVASALSRGAGGIVDAYQAVERECTRRVPPGTKNEAVVPELRTVRADAAARIFGARVELPEYSDDEESANAEDEGFFLRCTDQSFIKEYLQLVGLATVQDILERADLLGLGLKLLEEAPTECPLCGQSMDDALLEHVRQEHADLVSERKRSEALVEQRACVTNALQELGKRVAAYHGRNIDKTAPLLNLEPSLDKLRSVLVPKHQAHFDSVEGTISELASSRARLEVCYQSAVGALSKVQSSVIQSKEEAQLLRTLGADLVEYIAETRSYADAVSARAPAMSDADQVLKHKLDILAGTEDIAVLIDLVDKRRDVEKKLEMDSILAGLKDLRKSVDQFVASVVLEKISGDLSDEVTEWYGRIRTEGDPDVHFSGFDVPVTKKGDLRGGRIQVKATSYGEELVSAVSSLSESKLNVLGLCVCIATNLMSESPFDFLVIDDPIQSWDAEHETKFIEVVRSLAERGKQVILMSHRHCWLGQLRLHCRSMNGLYHEITGYTRDGPHIDEIAWASWEDRLREVDAILKDEMASTIRLQQAEAEIRFVTTTLTSEYYFRKKGVRRSPSTLNRAKVRKMLVQCGVDSELVDRACQTFGTTDDAHHASTEYAPERQRIRRYHSYCHELAKLLDEG